PVTEPTRIDFGRHRWDAGVHSPGHGKMGFFRTCIQADGHARNDNALEIAFAGPVSRVERPSNTFLDPEVAQPDHIVVVPAGIAAVLIFDLHEQNRAAVLGQVRLHDLGQFMDVFFHSMPIASILDRAKLDVRISQQVTGNATQIPFSATIGTGTEVYPHAFLASQAEKLADVTPPD